MKVFESLPSFPSFVILIIAFVILLFLVFITSYVKAPPDMAFIKLSAENPRLYRRRDESGFCFSFPDNGKECLNFLKKEPFFHTVINVTGGRKGCHVPLNIHRYQAGGRTLCVLGQCLRMFKQHAQRHKFLYQEPYDGP